MENARDLLSQCYELSVTAILQREQGCVLERQFRRQCACSDIHCVSQFHSYLHDQAGGQMDVKA